VPLTTDAEREAIIVLLRRNIEEVIKHGNLSVADEAMVPGIATRMQRMLATMTSNHY
jgi:hypothetical protein